MNLSRRFLAFDLGAESGRAILGILQGDHLGLDEVHRFPNGPVRVWEQVKGGRESLHWDAFRLWSEINQGIRLALAESQDPLTGIGVDGWGNDFGLLDSNGVLLSSPYHYRDSRTDGMLQEAFRLVQPDEIFASTGIQIMEVNGLYQLLSMVIEKSPVLSAARTFLTMPDLFNYWLTGRAVCEFTNATTTQCYDPRRQYWAEPMLSALGIPTSIFPPLVLPGTVLGPVLPYVADQVGLVGEVPVIAPACHDTGSAVVAVPADSSAFAWISSGSWSVVGAEVPEPIINADSYRFNLTNEGGAAGTFRFSKNVLGLWLVQECRRKWAREGMDLSYDALVEMAAAAEPLQAIIDPDHGEFVKFGDMPARIAAYCERTGQPVPATQGAIIRAVLEGIALKYRFVLERLESVLGRRLDPVHIVGGGTHNRLLSQFTANATGRSVITGPAEATTIGNILMQAIALGEIRSLAEARAIVRQTFCPDVFIPAQQGDWDEAYHRLQSLIQQTA